MSAYKDHVETVLKAVWDDFGEGHPWFDIWSVNAEYIAFDGGVLIVHKHGGLEEIHVAILPEHRGIKAVKDFSKLIKGKSYVAKIQIEKPHVKRFAIMCGMKMTHKDNQYYYMRNI